MFAGRLRAVLLVCVVGAAGCDSFRPLAPIERLEPRRRDPWPIQVAKGVAYVPAAAALLTAEIAVAAVYVGAAIAVASAGPACQDAAADMNARGSSPMQTRSPVFPP